LATLPVRYQAREMVGAPSQIGHHLAIFLGHPRAREPTYIADSEPISAQTITLSREDAKTEVEKDRVGFTL
jgi:hypothetical protein